MTSKPHSTHDLFVHVRDGLAKDHRGTWTPMSVVDAAAHAALDRIEEQLESAQRELSEATQDEIAYFKRMEELEKRLRIGADYGETPEIRAWCLLALAGAVNEASDPASEPEAS